MRLYSPIMSIGGRIRQLRQHYRLSQEAFGDLCSVTKGAVSQWESDETIPDTQKILMLREKLEFSCDWVLFGLGYSPDALSKPIAKLVAVAEKLPDDAVVYLTRQGDNLAELIEHTPKKAPASQ